MKFLKIDLINFGTKKKRRKKKSDASCFDAKCVYIFEVIMKFTFEIIG